MRIYEYLNGILAKLGVGDDNGVPTPSWRIEEYLKSIYDSMDTLKPTDEQVEAAVTDWLDDHPEATTTVEDGSITNAKLASSFVTPGTAAAYSSSATYAVGDYVFYNGALYKFTEDHAAGAWTGTDVEQTLTATELEALYAALANKANVDGSYSSLTAGNAEQLVSTVGVNDKTPYLFRTTGGSADVGDRVKLSEITGGTVAWNQLVPITAPSTTDVTNNGDGSFTVVSGADNYYTLTTTFSPVIGHKYLSMLQGGTDSTLHIRIESATGSPLSQKASYIVNASVPMKKNIYLRYRNIAQSTKVIPQLIDLTAMFGSTIADYLYTLEQNTVGAGVAWFRKLFPKDYYAYDAGSLLSVKTSAHKTIGFNAFDKAKMEDGYINDETGDIAGSATSKNTGYIQVVGGMTYYIKSDAESGRWGAWYDADKNFISGIAGIGVKTAPSNACYLRFTVVYNTVYGNPDTFCINLHWDGERDGEYEPYEEHSYALDDVELRGIPKLDANNNLYYDSDSYAPDGTVTRKYATRAYEAGDATDGSTMITDGTNTVYKLDTPTTESADPYQETQICNDFGTEEFVDSRTVPMPVGANALYQANLRAKLEMAPDSPSGDGDYIVRQTDGLNEYVALSSNSTISGLSTRCPACPTDTDGTFVLKATVSSGAVTYAWTAE